MTTVSTFWARIYVGLWEGYNGPLHSRYKVEDVCQRYCDSVGLCVTVEPCKFIYKHGREEGTVVGLINYPRFPKTPDEIKEIALELAEKLQNALGQLRLSVVFPDETVMLEA